NLAVQGFARVITAPRRAEVKVEFLDSPHGFGRHTCGVGRVRGRAPRPCAAEQGGKGENGQSEVTTIHGATPTSNRSVASVTQPEARGSELRNTCNMESTNGSSPGSDRDGLQRSPPAPQRPCGIS